jgi:hypothetical protein
VTVAELQSLLSDLAKFLRASGGAAVAGELDLISARLAPFSGQKLKAFGDFLIKAEEYSRGALAPKPTRTGGKAKADPAAVEKACRRVSELYDRAVDPAVSVGAIEEALLELQAADPPKAKLDEVAKRIGAARSFRSKPEVLKEIRAKLVGRKGQFDRVNA